MLGERINTFIAGIPVLSGPKLTEVRIRCAFDPDFLNLTELRVYVRSAPLAIIRTPTLKVTQTAAGNNSYEKEVLISGLSGTIDGAISVGVEFSTLGPGLGAVNGGQVNFFSAVAVLAEALPD